ncbi:hypothetical protein EYF80_049451 [Liparis tanakae]|uniref:Uncharacterized protein n=1 Tax=Liparis tanakae TaxID=230148 RepID=A0A4Z2FHZ8_9TELE|nr:hypothetical protein EYF80_049451 [Liparis tanakae]
MSSFTSLTEDLTLQINSQHFAGIVYNTNTGRDLRQTESQIRGNSSNEGNIKSLRALTEKPEASSRRLHPG